MSLVTGENLALLYGEVEIFSAVNLQINEESKIGIVGPNGSGKTSLLKLILGEYSPDKGNLSTLSDMKVAYVPQRPSVTNSPSVKDYIMGAFTAIQDIERLMEKYALEIQSSEGKDRKKAENNFSICLEKYDVLGGHDHIRQFELITTGLGLDEDSLNTSTEAASGGEITRASLAKAILSNPDLLILDEPTNYLDFQGLNWLEDYLAKFTRSLLIVSHDRYFLDSLVQEIWEVDRGMLISGPGNYSKYIKDKSLRLKREISDYKRQQEYIAKEEAFIQKYRAGQRSREARGRQTRLERLERIEKPIIEPSSLKVANIQINRSPQVPLKTRDLDIGFPHSPTRLIHVDTLELSKGTRTALIGPNGIGKSTLIKTLLGIIPPFSGKATLDRNVNVGYFSQGNIEFQNDSTVIESLIEIKNIPVQHARNHLARFLFKGDDIHKSIYDLSGGERGRLALARLLITDPNFLILDEPTTHLDIMSREALQEVLLAYQGTLLFVSHDRRLISSLANQLWIVEDKQIKIFKGTFEEWTKSPSFEDPRHSSPPNSAAKINRKRRGAKKIVQDKGLNYEEQIAQLEGQLYNLEEEIEKASNDQNIESVTTLGEKYAIVKSQLDIAWGNWAE